MGEPLQLIFGEVLKGIRKSQKMSQERLAVESALQRSFISRMERGQTQPTLVTLFELAKALHVNPADIIAEVQRRWQD